MLILLLLIGCSADDTDMNRALALREQLLISSCSFDTQITVDYGDAIYTFGMYCNSDPQGNVSFSVTDPATLCGISGMLTANGGRLIFDETALAFPMLAEGEVSPVSTPWLFLTALRSGYISSVGMEDALLRLTVNDTYAEDSLQLDIWLDATNVPQYAQITWRGRRVLSMQVSSFSIV